MWSPLVRRHLSDHLLWSIFSVIITHTLHITNHAGPSVWAAIQHSGHFLSWDMGTAHVFSIRSRVDLRQGSLVKRIDKRLDLLFLFTKFCLSMYSNRQTDLHTGRQTLE